MQFITIVLLAYACSDAWAIPKIDPTIEAAVCDGSTVNIFVSMAVGIDQVLTDIAARSRARHFADPGDKRTALYTAMRQHADESQAAVLDVLRGFWTLQVTSFWITNQIYIRDADKRLVALLSVRDDVSRIDKEDYVHGVGSKPGLAQQRRDAGYNLEKIRVPEVWAQNVNGTGVVIGSISTGVHHTHETLRDNYRDNTHSWFDAMQLPWPGARTPFDDEGEGTAEMSVMVGSLGVGVAFGAKWMACKALDNNRTGSYDYVLVCAQFMVCPFQWDGTRSDCTKGAHIVHIPFQANPEKEYDLIVNTWKEAGIIPVFAAHVGPESWLGCSSIAWPAWLDVVSVGATDSQDKLLKGSGQGPNPRSHNWTNDIKPEIVAPGLDVPTAHPAEDNAYIITLTDLGTPVAAAHVAGVIALLKGMAPDLTYEDVKQVLQVTAARELGFNGTICNRIPDFEFPNYQFGYGRLDAWAAYVCVRDGLTCLQEPSATTGGTEAPTTRFVVDTESSIESGLIIVIVAGCILIFTTPALIWWYVRRNPGRPRAGELQPEWTHKNQGYAGASKGGTRERSRLRTVLQQFHTGSLTLPTLDKDACIGAVGNYLALTTPYNLGKYEIQVEHVHIDQDRILGCGEFGVVHAGSLQRQEGYGHVEVAVKKLRASANVKSVTALLKELQIMIYVGKHLNLVRIFGASTQVDNVCIVLELCVNGNLEKYLRACRKVFTIQDEQEQPRDAREDTSKRPEIVDSHFLLQWSVDIASGMEFLVQRRVIHGDLACRNVLLNQNLVAKVSDFGLASRLYDYTKYVTLDVRPLPWRWMALESLQDLRFSHASDVWSYGVTVWEIFSLAETPYPGTAWSADFVQQLEAGLRNERPNYASEEIYALVEQCWLQEPATRPTVSRIRESFSCLLNK